MGAKSKASCACTRQTRRSTGTEKPGDNGGRDWSEATTGPGIPKATRAGRGRKDPPLEPPEEGGPATTWILDFRPPELCENQLVMSSATSLRSFAVSAQDADPVTSHGVSGESAA